jgi:hypothetical protein
MKENSEKIMSQREADDATMNFVSRQAQEAILAPDLPEFFKDQMVDAAVKTILRIAEKRSGYDARPRKHKQVTEAHTIYKAK